MSAKRGIVCALYCVLLCCAVSAEPEVQSPSALLDHLAGNWILQGTIAGKQTTHDVQATWVLNHEYLQLHEVSREKNGNGTAAYEAIIYIEWDAKTRQYNCLWLDSTSGGGLSSPDEIAHAKEGENAIPFIFGLSASDQIHTTFSYDKTADTWRWLIENIVNGKAKQFADVKLSRVR